MTRNFKTAEQTMEQLYLDRDDTGDITFLVGSQRIRAHRSLLAAHSPRYKAQFYGTHADSNEIFIPNVSAAAFNVFLQFFYKQTVDLTMENIKMVLDLAQQSLVDEFVESCATFLLESITPSNLFEFYDLAILYGIKTLRLGCEQPISENTLRVFGSNDFLQSDRDVLLQILKMDALNCNETDVLRACITWAREQCKRDNLFRSPENLRAALGDAIHQIRFSSFTAEEFDTLHKSMEGFFQPDEVIEILRIIDELDDFEALKFNGNQLERSKAVHRTPCWLLQCNRHSRAQRWFNQPRQIEQTDYFHFHFSCNKPIRLHGIAFDFHFDDDDLDNFPETITIRLRRNDNGPLISFQSKYKVYQNPKKNDETVIMFDEPIDQVIYCSGSFQLPKLQFIYGPELKPYVHVYDRQFTLCSGSVSRLYFDLMREDVGFHYDFGPFVRSSKKYKIPIYNWSPIFIEAPNSSTFYG